MVSEQNLTHFTLQGTKPIKNQSKNPLPNTSHTHEIPDVYRRLIAIISNLKLNIDDFCFF